MKTLGIRKILRQLTLSLVTAMMFMSCQSGPPQISIEGAKAELSPAIVGEAMVTMNIRNQGGSDLLTGVKTDVPGAKVLFHIMQGERMVTSDKVKIPAKNITEFKMGDSHIMIEDMPKTMQEGSHFNVTLLFEKAGEKQISLTLQKAEMMNMEHQHHM